LIEMSGNGNVPGIAYLDASSGAGGKLCFLTCNYAGDPHDMINPAKWYGKDIDGTEGAGYDCSLAAVQGNPAVAYTNIVNGGVYYARADGFIGAGENNWNVYTVDSDSNAGEWTSLAVVGANPAIACYTQFSGLAYYYSAQNDGEQGWMTPVTAAAGGGVGQGASLIELPGGLPGISYRDGTKLSFARSPDYDGASGFQVIALDPTGSFDIEDVTSLALINGNPAIATLASTNGELWFARCTLDNGGTGVSDWDFAQIDSGVGTGLALAQISNHPAVAAWKPDSPDNFQHYAEAADADGADGNWTRHQLVDDIGPSAGGACSLALVDNWPVMCYQDTASHKLRIAVFF
jgi:hypothetical protein